MKIDTYQLDLEQARTGKSWRELGVDPRLVRRAREGRISPVGLFRLASALGVDPERITVREG